ncbi:MAG: hypothetical protein HC846_02150 [Blastocatellia bacterium]|nr:hypothetical protein [Blastocatellia bacterium]
MHAEAEALIKAKEKFGNLEGEEIKLYVDRRTCEECYKNLPIIMALWGIKK